MANDDLIDFEFDVEDGRARVTGSSEWGDHGYVTCIVRREDGSEYATVRPAAHVRQRKGVSGE